MELAALVFVLVSLIIGFFFATCMLIGQALLLLVIPPLVLPFVGGTVFAYFLQKRGWYEDVSWLGKILVGFIGLPSAIAIPVFVELGASYLSMTEIELPPKSIVIERYVGLGAGYIVFESNSGFDDLKAHFLTTRGVDGWQDVRTYDPSDDAEALQQSNLRHRYNGYSYVINRCGEKSCATVGWRIEPALNLIVALIGLLILLCMVAFGPPKRTRK